MGDVRATGMVLVAAVAVAGCNVDEELGRRVKELLAALGPT